MLAVFTTTDCQRPPRVRRIAGRNRGNSLHSSWGMGSTKSPGKELYSRNQKLARLPRVAWRFGQFCLCESNDFASYGFSSRKFRLDERHGAASAGGDNLREHRQGLIGLNYHSIGVGDGYAHSLVHRHRVRSRGRERRNKQSEAKSVTEFTSLLVCTALGTASRRRKLGRTGFEDKIRSKDMGHETEHPTGDTYGVRWSLRRLDARTCGV